jgi:hypothetical protein
VPSRTALFRRLLDQVLTTVVLGAGLLERRDTSPGQLEDDPILDVPLRSPTSTSNPRLPKDGISHIESGSDLCSRTLGRPSRREAVTRQHRSERPVNDLVHPPGTVGAISPELLDDEVPER